MVRALHLQDRAAALSSEAATWRLLWHLYGISDRSYPGGAGGPRLPGCAHASTVAQQIARILEQDADINRYARLDLAWVPCSSLESALALACNQHCSCVCACSSRPLVMNSKHTEARLKEVADFQIDRTRHR